jgi:hypothetical protein
MYNLTRARILDVFLRLPIQQFLRQALQILLATVLCEHADFRQIVHFLLVLPILFVQELTLCRVSVEVDVVASMLGLPGEELHGLHFRRFARITQEIVAGKNRLPQR